MDPVRFDSLARRLVHATSRRQVLKGLAVALVGAAAPVGSSAAPGGNSACAHFCASVFGEDTPEAGACTSAAAHHGGLCYQCGPASDGSLQLCGTHCIPPCTARDQCHVAGTCDPVSGQCTNPIAINGTPCDDGNACTTNDVCTDGVCAGTPVDCSSENDQCNVGKCDPTTGSCTPVPVADGTPCDDGDACTTNDVCTNGTCSGTAVVCPEADVCLSASGCQCTNGGTTNGACGAYDHGCGEDTGCCRCVTTPEGLACVNWACSASACGAWTPCTTSADCPDQQVCTLSTCCDTNICQPLCGVVTPAVTGFTSPEGPQKGP